MHKRILGVSSGIIIWAKHSKHDMSIVIGRYSHFLLIARITITTISTVKSNVLMTIKLTSQLVVNTIMIIMIMLKHWT